jgi:two-component system, chemotaxis family, CheB/CheR fusion protein
LFDEPPDEGIRAWVAGCATGEEAYSLAIVMLEEAQRRKVQVPIQIFASDLDQGALGTAREGRYPRSIEANVSDERLQRFFIDERTHYRVRTELRDIVLFASHSVLREPPFLRLDLITCRNLLIYLERGLQQQLMRLFHYGLRPNACLFLGSAETVDASSDLFATIDREARLYRARAQAVRSLPIIAQASGGHAEPGGGLPHPVMRERSDPSPASVHAAALERIAPPSVLVDAGHQILHMSPTAGRFILHSAGPFSGRLPAVVRPELRLDLKVALDRAFERSLPTMTLATPVALNGGRHRVAVHVLPVLVEEHSPSQTIVLFIDGGPIDVDELARLDEDELPPDELRRLYAELKAAQEALVESRGEHESAIQDLRAANEELQSINEEYRSTSEELETSKEELQSMNEELQTVNAELKSKLESISTAHSDLQNLTAATEIGTLFLDTELRIRMFTPSVAYLFNITEGDVGRAITDFTHRLAYDGLEWDARSVLRDLAPIETEVKSRDAHWYMMRLRPYRTIENHINGVVLSFVDSPGGAKRNGSSSRASSATRPCSIRSTRASASSR